MPSIISHSEVDQFLNCERKHFYAFGKLAADGSNGLQSKHISDGLYKGNLGHAALEVYYKALEPYITSTPTSMAMSGAKEAALKVITEALVADPERSEIILNVYAIVEAYLLHYMDEDQNGWQYLAVETEFRENIDGDITFPFKPDLIRRSRRTGEVQVVDHKFLANLYGPDEIAIQPQLAKYVGSLRNQGYEVKDGVYNLISTRVLKTKPYVAEGNMRRSKVGLTNKRVARALEEQHRVVRRIATLKAMPLEQWEDAVNRSATAYNCKNCPFLKLCIADSNGEDTTVMVREEYESNSYGYDKEKS